MWLRAETGNRAYFTDASGSSFELPADVAWDVRSLVVEGQPLKAPASMSGPTIATPSAGASTPGPSRQIPFTAIYKTVIVCGECEAGASSNEQTALR